MVEKGKKQKKPRKWRKQENFSDEQVYDALPGEDEEIPDLNDEVIPEDENAQEDEGDSL